MTNADRIRAMTDDELAVEFADYLCDKMPEGDERCKRFCGKCTTCRLDWLKQEDEE